MNAVEFLSNHRVVVNRQARGAPLPHLTDSAVKMTLAELNKGVSHDTIPWRGRGGGMPSHSGVEFERQLDKISIWLEGWNHTQVGLSQPPSLTSIGLIFSLQVLSQVFLHCDHRHRLLSTSCTLLLMLFRCLSLLFCPPVVKTLMCFVMYS